jgi:hypothetical protein
MPLVPQVTLHDFDKWKVDLVGLINPTTKRSIEIYIITTTNYLTRWDEEEPVRYCRVETVGRFIFENFATKFECPRIPLIDQGTHFLKRTIVSLMEEFHIHHHKRTHYHPQVNRTVEAFKKIL